jgi:hypothetical protein
MERNPRRRSPVHALPSLSIKRGLFQGEETMSHTTLLQMLSHAGRTIRGRLIGPAPKQSSRRQRGFRPGLEALEDRSLPSSLPILPPPQLGHPLHGHSQFARVHHHAGQHVAILSPSPDAVAGRISTLSGQITGNGHGWPVVLVQPVLAGEPWYVQPEVTAVQSNGTFSTPVYIGSATTPPHTQFRIVVILAHNHKQAHAQFPEGKMLKSLPAGLPASQTVFVFRAGSSSGGHGGGIS